MRFNVTDEELNAPMVEPGTYPARIDKVKDTSSQKGNPMFYVTWTLMGDAPPAGQKVFENFTMTPEAYWKLADLFQATGFKSTDGTGFDSMDLVGQVCRLVLVEDEYEGRKRAKVKTHLPMA